MIRAKKTRCGAIVVVIEKECQGSSDLPLAAKESGFIMVYFRLPPLASLRLSSEM